MALPESTSPSPPPSLIGWIVRDGTIFTILALLLWLIASLFAMTQWTIFGLLGAVLGFIAAYAICYIFHEWGHLLGARSAKSCMPLNTYKGVAIGTFDIARHTRHQFLALSWGGVAGYSLATTLFVLYYINERPDWIAAGLAIGGLAFIVQSWAVDLPQIWRVLNGAEPLKTNQEGATKTIILRRTWQTWLPLTAILALYNMLST